MTERFEIKDEGWYTIYDNEKKEYVISDGMLNAHNYCKELCNLLNELATKCSKLEKKNEQLKAQLKKGEDVCSICKHQYLTKKDTDKYYIAKCKKEHIECSKDTVNYCEDFECKEVTE